MSNICTSGRIGPITYVIIAPTPSDVTASISYGSFEQSYHTQSRREARKWIERQAAKILQQTNGGLLK